MTQHDSSSTPEQLPASNPPPPHDTGGEKVPLAVALKRHHSRTHVQPPAIHFSIPKPEGEQGRASNVKKKGYLLKEVLMKALSWSPEKFAEAQDLIDTSITKHLDINICRTSQKSASLENLRAELVKMYSFIDEGESDWIFKDFVTAGLKREKERQKRKVKQSGGNQSSDEFSGDGNA
ncbi:hypothetical protein HWV62_28005 [Athelia sp. TMB]|nr:hypothetical protein HWV62_28005 [Athelia sp. TMB]